MKTVLHVKAFAVFSFQPTDLFMLCACICNVGLVSPALKSFSPRYLKKASFLNLWDRFWYTKTCSPTLTVEDWCDILSSDPQQGALKKFRFGTDSRPADWVEDLLPNSRWQECWGQESLCPDVTGFAAILGPVILWHNVDSSDWILQQTCVKLFYPNQFIIILTTADHFVV